MATLTCSKRAPTVYRPRKPEKTVLFEAIKKNYTTWNKNTKDPIPKHVDTTFKKYLGCGILAKGFAHAHCASCQKDFLIAFSCKGRGICPSCNTRAMVETAAHLIENVIPLVPIRQWVISFPIRIRHYLKTPTILQDVLRIVVDEIRKRLINCSPNMPDAKIGAVSFIQNFGTTLNFHPHFHLIVADGVFGSTGEVLQFNEAFLNPDDISDTQDCIHKRVLKFFGKKGWFEQEDIEKMLAYENSGFSLDAGVRIHSWDRDGLERLIRYCARPCFASENLRWNGPWLIYRLSKPNHKGQTFVQLDPLEFLDRIAAFIPPPRRHRHHYHGVFAPNSSVRKKVTAHAKKRIEHIVPPFVKEAAEKIEKVSFNWAKLIARIYEADPLICKCGKEIKIIAFVTHEAEIRRILRGIGWPTEPPDFDPPYELIQWDVCQLIPGTKDGFPDIDQQAHCKIGPDPPAPEETCDPPYWLDYSDPPHQDYSDPPHWSD